jgi:hypothetical protein
MAKKEIIKDVSDFNVEIADNGYVLNYSGNNSEGDWKNTKIVVTTIDELISEIKRIVALP